MAIVCTVLLNSVYNFYTDEFISQIDYNFRGELREMLQNALFEKDWAKKQKEILNAYGTSLGIDDYRNYYILDKDGNFVEGSNKELGNTLIKTPNLINAMNGSDSGVQLLGTDYTDYAVSIKNGENKNIIYIKDTQEEMQKLCWKLFSIILQSVLIGFIIAVILSFFLAKAITSPIQNLTRGAEQLAYGKFNHFIDVHSSDEIGTLTTVFNNMGKTLVNTINEVSDERQKLDIIFTYLREAVIAFTDDGFVLNINKSAKDLFNIQTSKSVSESIESFSIDKLFDMLSINYAKSYMKSITSEAGYILRDVEYKNKILDLNFGVIKYLERGLHRSGLIVVLHDMTSRYELDKSQKEFVANVSHELRSPLTSIRGAVETILLNPDMPDDIKENLLNMAIEESDSMLRIIEELLILSRFDNKKTQWQITDFDIKHSIVHVCELLKSEAEKHGQVLGYDFRGEIPNIIGDEKKIERVLINIITNAIKYTNEEGKIDVRALYGGNDTIKIYVRDNGIGIPEEDISHLFDRFYRVDKSRTNDTGSTGLGLAIVKEIVDAHGGSITIKSKLGQGTLVTIVLPVKSEISNDE